MARQFDTATPVSREEDYRDYKARDLEDGWPYADPDSGGEKRNEAYAGSPAGPEDDGNVGFETASDTVVENGARLPSPTASTGSINDDALEDAIFDQFMGEDDIDEDQIVVTVRNGVVELTGNVDKQETAFLAEQRAGAVAGVRLVRNRLVTLGVDSHIPDDASD